MKEAIHKDGRKLPLKVQVKDGLFVISMGYEVLADWMETEWDAKEGNSETIQDPEKFAIAAAKAVERNTCPTLEAIRETIMEEVEMEGFFDR